MLEIDPFATLGIAPTLERDAIKQAYFGSVRLTPPHRDPEAFRQLRAAYEQLSDGPALLRAWLQAPLDTDAELERWQARWQARVDASCAEDRANAQVARAVELVIERCMHLRID